MTAAALLTERPSGRSGVAADPPIRLLIVDDSSVARAVLSRMVSIHPEFELVGTAGSADEAVAALRSIKVDIVLLDVEMPGSSGLDALPQIIASGDGARVLIVSSMAEAGAETAVRALAFGAADALLKPGGGAFTGRFSDILAERLRRIGRAQRVYREGPVSAAASIRLRDPGHDAKLACIAVGASTGGLHAINAFLGGLPRHIGAPILVTQHLPPIFMPYFARQLEAASGRKSRVVVDGERLQPDEIHVAPGTAHLGLQRWGSTVRVHLDTRPTASGCLPSVDPMLAAVAEIYGRGGAAVVLSGMGRDGLKGSQVLATKGGIIFVQDQHSAAIWGMPRAVAEAGLASAVLPPADLARRVAARIGGAAWR